MCTNVLEALRVHTSSAAPPPRRCYPRLQQSNLRPCRPALTQGRGPRPTQGWRLPPVPNLLLRSQLAQPRRTLGWRRRLARPRPRRRQPPRCRSLALGSRPAWQGAARCGVRWRAAAAPQGPLPRALHKQHLKSQSGLFCRELDGALAWQRLRSRDKGVPGTTRVCSWAAAMLHLLMWYTSQCSRMARGFAVLVILVLAIRGHGSAEEGWRHVLTMAFRQSQHSVTAACTSGSTYSLCCASLQGRGRT